VFGLDLFGWAVVAGVAGVVAVIATIAMPFISNAILTRRKVTVTFGKDEFHGDTSFTVDILNRGNSWIRIEKRAQLRVWDRQQSLWIPISGYVGPMYGTGWGGALHAGDSMVTEFDERAVATRLSEMGYAGVQHVLGEYQDRDGKILRTKTRYPIRVDELKQADA
jgi:hypothetical protein